MTNYFPAFAALVGTIIGAGILAIPYVIAQSGIIIGIIHLISISVLVLITFLYLGEISLRTKTNHHLVGYASLYLGKKGKSLMIAAIVIEIYAAVLAYLVGMGESLSFLFFQSTQYQLHFGILTWIIMSSFIYFGIKALKEGETIGIIFISIMIISIIVLFWNKISYSNISYINLDNIFLPFGVILFAFLGFVAIPEVKRILGDETKSMKKVIISAILFSLIIYLIFSVIVAGSLGQSTPSIATLGMGKPFILLGIFTMFTSYLALSIALSDSIRYDFRKTKFNAWLYTVIIPLILLVLLNSINKTNFILILGIGGVISGGLMGILILSMVKNAKILGTRNPEYSIPYSPILTWILIIIFIIGTVLEILNAIM